MKLTLLGPGALRNNPRRAGPSQIVQFGAGHIWMFDLDPEGIEIDKAGPVISGDGLPLDDIEDFAAGADGVTVDLG